MGQALYRRYRSKNLAEIVGQEHITRTLDNTLKRGAIGHAYLLTGPRGVGKTSIARILAHEINELPYESEKIHLDIIEIDAASNRRIDEIRDLRDKVHIAPTSAKYKVYIIDEVHMLTKEAFNALLKTLEEPPRHVIFILATTDVHKLPETIISRTQHFTFKPISIEKIVSHLKSIATQEQITIEDEALNIIATHAGGSFRDSIGLLEQASGLSDTVTADHVRTMLGVPPDSLIATLLDAFDSGDAPQLVKVLTDLRVQGFLAEEIAHYAGAALRNRLLEGGATSQVPALIAALIDVQTSREPHTLLEIILLTHMNLTTTALPKPSKTTTKPQMTQEPKQTEKKLPESAKSDTEPVETNKVTKEESNHEQSESATKTPTTPSKQINTGSVIVNDEHWEATLEQLKKAHSTLYSMARMAEFTSDGDDITLAFKFPFHKKRMESSKHKTILDELLHAITGGNPVVNFALIDKNKPAKQQEAKPKTQEKPPLEAISNIFGGAEVLES